mmetsp:Transcript_5038/g.8414  ORF Transcript_5038/g.8414 Transcript_5038/m.8414 type:complete len:323 (+) Transcript_5038:135-1103(+)
MNAACAGTTQAIGIAQDMMRAGRCERVIVVAGDNASGKSLLPWLANGFRALGAASTAGNVSLAALPFDARRNGMLLGAGAIGMVLETEAGFAHRQSLLPPLPSPLSPPSSSASAATTAAVAGGISSGTGGEAGDAGTAGDDGTEGEESRNVRSRRAKCRLLATQYSNSAYHGAALCQKHIASELRRFLATVEADHGISVEELAKSGIYFSHETCTHAAPKSSCAYNEVGALREAFGAHMSELLLLNTKGFTGHPMGVSFEDVTAVEALFRGMVPPLANYKVPDAHLGSDLNLSKGGSYDAKYALRFAAGFGSHVCFALYGAV